jgi:L-ribulose-5-phosphate 3-epimerase
MIQPGNPARRRFMQGAAALMLSQPLLSLSAADDGRAATKGLAGRVYKTLKAGMVRVPGSLQDKFQAAKDAGFEGIELASPGIDVEAARKAIQATGLPVDGSVGGSHWQIRHTSADPAERAQALADLKTAIRQTHAVGGHTVLLVVGHGDDGTEQECWDRSIENISQALPLASELGMVIAIENVWNKFLYNHEGGPDQSAEKFIKYVDAFDSPWVGMQFDIGNHWKYGNTGDWIRALGKRIVKLDIKGFSRQTDKFTKIGEGDIDWADVRRALIEIKYTGWVAAEVGGGDLPRLREIAANMDRALELKPTS